MADLLIELLCEEIPARMQARASEDLKRLITDGLVEAGLTYASAGAEATPRRLSLVVEDVLSESPTRTEERKGPKVGAPEKALEGFLRSTGLTRDALEERDTPKGGVWFAQVTIPGRPASEIVAEVLDTTVRHFPWPKSMRWGASDLRWVRPLQGILCILSDEAGTETVPLEIEGVRAGDMTTGHRFLGGKPFSVRNFEDYEAKLKRAHVILRSGERGAAIWNEIESQAFALGLSPVEDKGLLAEVAGLVEWPVVLLGPIDEAFLELPPEVLRTSMKEHQKFFSLAAKNGRITHFATVANIDAPDGGQTILAGNRKVLAARLSDAKFFWENDLAIAKTGMGVWSEALEKVTFHAGLGSQADRVTRIGALAREIAPSLQAEPERAEAAALVAKSDLASEMVYEFPELQGVMGAYYAEAGGHPEDVSAVAREHYHPLGPSDEVPNAPLSVSVALADRIDMLTGFWAIDEKPTGSKDPFALRRAALGAIRLVLENEVRSNLLDWFAAAWPRPDADQEMARKDTVGETQRDLVAFFHDRLKVHLRDEGIRHDVIDAVLAMPGSDDLWLVVARAEALNAFLSTEDGENLVQGFRRANNILTQAETADGVEYSFGADSKFAEANEEKALFEALDAARAAIGPAMESEDFEAAMAAMAGLRAPIDAFFDAVQVNASNSTLRRNRLNLLNDIRQICAQVADLSRLEG